MIRADLHIHSEYSSDGEFRVADIVGKCAAGGVDLFSLTDHNTVRGLDEACDGALQAGLEFVPGIEIDCSFEGTDLHLLGYGIDWKSPDFRTLEETVAAEVMASFGETVGKLRRLGFAVDEQAVLAAAAGKLPTMELIAEVMLSDPACDTPLLAPYREGGASLFERDESPPVGQAAGAVGIAALRRVDVAAGRTDQIAFRGVVCHSVLPTVSRTVCGSAL